MAAQTWILTPARSCKKLCKYLHEYDQSTIKLSQIVHNALMSKMTDRAARITWPSSSETVHFYTPLTEMKDFARPDSNSSQLRRKLTTVLLNVDRESAQRRCDTRTGMVCVNHSAPSNHFAFAGYKQKARRQYAMVKNG
jgi:hypothetical protein